MIFELIFLYNNILNCFKKLNFLLRIIFNTLKFSSTRNKIMKLRVYYEDTDLGGVVYHSKYLNFCERARSEIFFEKGASPVFEDYHFVVKSIEANFLSSAKLGDILEIKTQVLEIKRVSITLFQTIFNENLKRDIFEMKVVLVCLKNDKISKIPEYFLKIFD